MTRKNRLASIGFLAIPLAVVCFGAGGNPVSSGPYLSSGEDDGRIVLSLRTQQLQAGPDGRRFWMPILSRKSVVPSQTALLICDMWDRHWSRGATDRVNELAPRIDALAAALRLRGVLIIHSPSDTMDFYQATPARERTHTVPLLELERVRRIELPQLPIDDSDGGSDTGEKPWHKAWTRQHPAITIDPSQDIISADGREIFSYCRSQGIRTILFAGVHTNMCVLKSRSFSLQPMAELGMEVILVRDLTDTMYNPARAPYVSHEEGTRLVVEYIEKFLCPTATSEDLHAQRKR